MIVVEHVTKTFERMVALDDLTVSLPKGKIIGLVGPDGAGKTTLIRLFAGLLLPTSGRITVAGYDTVKSAKYIHELIGYMPQRFGLYEDLTVEQNLSLYADLQGVLKEERKAVFEKLLQFTNLGRFTKRLAKDLSGGMKQKLGLACTLIRKPALLLLDEPSVGVDPISRRELWKMIEDLQSEGISILWSTSYLDEAEKCHSVLLLNMGKLLYSGLPSVLTKAMEGRTFKVPAPNHDRRSMLFSLINQADVVDGIMQGNSVRLVLKKGAVPKANYQPVAPRFEDAFVDLLGGAPKGKSQLAENSPRVLSKNEYVVEAKKLTKYFGSFVAANEITFEIPSGEIFGLLGPNGAGKSTTFKMLCGLLKPTTGLALVKGENLQHATSLARYHIGYMAQKFSLYEGLTALQNLQFFSRIYGLQQDAVDKMISIFNFQELATSATKDLPLGFKQRLALACACMHHPEVIFLDEPTSGVDPITRREFWNHINGLVEKGTTVVVTTHFMDEAEYCDRIGLIYQGKLITIGAPDTLKQMAKTEKNPEPTLEDAFIHLIEGYDVNKKT